MSAMGRVLPDRWWRSDGVLTAMGPAAGLMLGVGRVGLRGTVPNGQRFQAAPFRIRRVRDSHAVIGGVDVGPPGPLPVQERLGDFWLPQRGMVAEGRSSFEALDPQRHSTATSR